MKVGVPKEIAAGERRVALVPETVGKLVGDSTSILVESGAGSEAGFLDDAYRDAGATTGDVAAAMGADVVVKVLPPMAGDGADEVGRLREGATLIAFLQPLTSPALIRALAARGVTSLSMELVPRITRAQRMDALSSQATVAGYHATLVAAAAVDKFFPMMMTAAGTIRPSRALILGAGVAGLQAIATARRLGAMVEAFDIRPAVKEQVESLGAKFVGLTLEEAETEGGYAKEVTEEQEQKEHELLHELVQRADVVITTAQVPGRPAPRLITADMVADMRPGAVIVDLAAESGGNCELTRAGEEAVEHGVRIVGLVNSASSLPYHASQMYSRNIAALLQHLAPEGRLVIDLEDEITGACCVTHAGEIVNERVKETVGAETDKPGTRGAH